MHMLYFEVWYLRYIGGKTPPCCCENSKPKTALFVGPSAWVGGDWRDFGINLADDQIINSSTTVVLLLVTFEIYTTIFYTYTIIHTIGRSSGGAGNIVGRSPVGFCRCFCSAEYYLEVNYEHILLIHQSTISRTIKYMIRQFCLLFLFSHPRIMYMYVKDNNNAHR